MNSILNFRVGRFGHPAHLSDEQIDDHLIGDLAAEAEAHLGVCSACTRRVVEAEAVLANFRAVAMEWSERRSATIPLHTATAQEPRWAQRFALGTATAALLAATFVLPTFPTSARTPAAQTASSATVQTVARVEPVPQPLLRVRQATPVRSVRQTVVDDRDISNDNQMLQQIDVALSTPSASPASLGLETVSSEESTAQRAPVMMQN